MINTVNEIISGLDVQHNYVLKNTDFTSNYDHIIVEQLEHNKNGFNDYSVLIQLFDHFDLSYDANKLDQYWHEFLTTLSYGHFDSVVKNCGYLNEVKNDCFLQISIGEQEYHLHDNWDNLTFKNGIKEYINKHTDYYVSGSYAYIDMSQYYILYTADKDYLIDLIEGVNTDD